MPFFEGSRGRVHYRRWPAADPRVTLVFLHGRGQHTGQYHRFGAAMAAHGITTWALDHVGHGLSEGEIADGLPYLDALAENAGHLVDLAGGEVSVMGHSLGSATAVRLLASGASARSVVLVAVPPRAVVDGDFTSACAAPTLVLHGIDDRMVGIDGVRELTRETPTVTLKEYADAGHDLLHEKIHRTVTDDAARHILAHS
ncbi:MAG: alpha/beta fold hydrolase [Rhodococcus sp. (in: high G+C Gram-positive bacteria)]